MISHLFFTAVFGREFVMSQITPGPKHVSNNSLLPPLWFFGLNGPQPPDAGCFQNFNGTGLAERTSLFLGPSFVDPVKMTVELCVKFCDQENYHLAGLVNGDTCQCSNLINPHVVEFEGFEFTMCEGIFGVPCVGDPTEACGGDPFPGAAPLLSIYERQDGRCAFDSPTKNLTVGDWRFVYLFNDTVGARALKHNAVDLHPGLPRGNLTLESCTNACAASGFLIAGVEFADECYCGNEFQNNPLPVPGLTIGCPFAEVTAGPDAFMSCKGNAKETCGGSNVIGIYILPGTTLTPIIPFGSLFDGL